MGIMRKSARILGQEFGLTAQEMNFILKEDGYLDGEPGRYTVTEKGQVFAREQDHHRGTGGYDYYNRRWSTISWDEKIADELNITDKRKRRIRQTISIAKQKTKEPIEDFSANKPECYSYENNYEPAEVGEEFNDEIYEEIGRTIGNAIIEIATYASPYIKLWWNKKAIPSLKKKKDKIARKIKNKD